MENFGGEYVKINEQYFQQHSDFKELLHNKNGARVYLGILLELSNELKVFVPFRSQTPNNLRVQEKGIFPIPSQTRPYACLDFTKLLIINEDEPLLKILQPNEVQLPRIQRKAIENGFQKIVRMAKSYVTGYRKYVKNQRRRPGKADPLYHYSTLQNYHKELEIE